MVAIIILEIDSPLMITLTEIAMGGGAYTKFRIIALRASTIGMISTVITKHNMQAFGRLPFERYTIVEGSHK